MYKDPIIYNVNQIVNATGLNADAYSNMVALFSQTSAPSLLNPLVAGVVTFSTQFNPATTDSYGSGFKLGAVGMEYTTDSAGAGSTKQWRVAITYTLATNAATGSSLRLNRRVLSGMNGPSTGPSTLQQIFASVTRTSAGSYTEVGPWSNMTNSDQIWEIRAWSQATNANGPKYSRVSACFQVRTI